jgi:hypothetical protein
VRIKPNVQWRLAGVGKRLRHHRNEACVSLMSVAVYWYIQDLLPVCTGMYFSYLKLAFFENRHHHSISLAVELYAVTVCSRRAAGMYEKPSCLVFGTYQYIPVCTVNEFLYSHIPVHTGTYRYIRFCPILSRCTGFQMWPIVQCQVTASPASIP